MYSGKRFFILASVPKTSIIVSKNITYGAWFDAIHKAGKNLDLDPRLVALVQFMARRAAERDFATERGEDEVHERADHTEDTT
jgi:hypothetical protein